MTTGRHVQKMRTDNFKWLIIGMFSGGGIVMATVVVTILNIKGQA